MCSVVQVGNLGLLFMLLFFIYAALGVELFGELGKNRCLLYSLLLCTVIIYYLIIL